MCAKKNVAKNNKNKKFALFNKVGKKPDKNKDLLQSTGTYMEQSI